MADPVQLIADTVRSRARRGELAVGPEAAVREELRRYAEHAFGSDAPLIADEARAERQVVADLTGFGPLQPLLDDPTIEEIWINASDALNYAGLEASVRRESAEAARAAVTRP